MLLISFLFFLHLAQSSSDSCTFDPEIIKRNGRDFDCLKLYFAADMALCLLQSNSLEKTMQCAAWPSDQVLWFEISKSSEATEVDLVCSRDNYDAATGKLRYPTWKRTKKDHRVEFTPRSLIVAATIICAKQERCENSFYRAVAMCPHEDMVLFQRCLFCHGVKKEDVRALEGFIQDFKFGGPPYNPPTQMDWDVHGKCQSDDPDLDDDGHDMILKAKVDEDSDQSFDFTYTMSATLPTDSVPIPDLPTAQGPQTLLDDDKTADETGSVSSRIVANTGTVTGTSAAPTSTSSPTEGTSGSKSAAPIATSSYSGDTSSYKVVKRSLLGTLFIVNALLLC